MWRVVPLETQVLQSEIGVREVNGSCEEKETISSLEDLSQSKV